MPCLWGMCVFFLYSMLSTLKKHIKSTHYKGEKRLKCTVCPFATSNLDSFRCHKQRVHGERKKTCVREKCGYITYTRGGLKRHQESHLSMEERKKSTNIILVLVNSLTWGNLKKHVKVEHDKVVLPVKTFECYDCNYTATRTTTLKLHKKSIHQKRLTMSPYWRLSTILVFVASNTKCDFCTRER